MLRLPAGPGAFTGPTLAAVASHEGAPFAPNLSLAFSGKDPYRPWVDCLLDGVLCFFNGHDRPWRYEVGVGAYDIGSDAPGFGDHSGATFATALWAGGTWLADTETARYVFTFRNTTLGKETAPQGADGYVEVTNNAGAARGVTVTTPAAPAGTEFDKCRIYRVVRGGSSAHLVTETNFSTAYNDSTSWADLLLAEAYIERSRTTKPPRYKVGVAWNGRLFAATCDDSQLDYGQATRVVDGEWMMDDIPERNLLQVGQDDDTGAIRALFVHYSRLYVFKERAIYVVEGDPTSLFTVTRLFSGRGALAQGCIVPAAAAFVALDRAGAYLWAPGSDPVPLGSASPNCLAPVWRSLNVDAADLFAGVFTEATDTVELLVATGWFPGLNTCITINVRTGAIVSVDYDFHAGAAGHLEDAAGGRHHVFGDDLGFLWQRYAQDSQGPREGTLSIAVTGGTVKSWAASGAAFSTDSLDGAVGAPCVLVTEDGALLEANRAVSVSATAIVPLYYGEDPPDSTQLVVVGIIPWVCELPPMRLDDGRDRLFLHAAFSFEAESASDVVIEAAPDAEDFRIVDGTAELDDGEPVLVRLDMHGEHLRVRLSQVYPSMRAALVWAEAHVVDTGVRGGR